MGYAYSFGDLFLELDGQHLIQNIDGPLSEVFQKNYGIKKATNLNEHLCSASVTTIEKTFDGVVGFNRVGPFELQLASSKKTDQKFIAFICKLPGDKDLRFLSLLSASRYSLNRIPHAAQIDMKDNRDLIEQMTTFSEADLANDNLLVTLVECDEVDKSHVSDDAIQQQLNTYSMEGKQATILSNGKYALVREKTPHLIDIAKEIAELTGLTLSTADISAKSLKAGDNLKALVYSLKQYADGAPDFCLTAFKNDSVTLFGAATKKVKAFRDTVSKNKFDIAYQPIVSLPSGELHHYEALARFPKKENNSSPYEVISFAEKTGIIDDFDLAVFIRVTDKLIALEKKNLLSKIAINLSGQSITDERFQDRFFAKLEKLQRFSEVLAFEITESFKISDLTSAAKVIDKIRAFGFKVYLDDFGSEAAGFQYLQALDVDALKIDGSYITKALTSRKDKALLVALAALCKDLKIKTVAEWVENKAIADLVTEIGIDYGQGYYFGKPGPML